MVSYVTSDLFFIGVPQHSCVESWFDLHRHQFLQEKFACVGDSDLDNVLTRVTKTAMVLPLIEIGLTEETTLPADMHTVAV